MSSVLQLLRPGATAPDLVTPSRRWLSIPHPIVMMLLIIIAAMVLTWLIPSGQFERAPNGHVLPGTYHAIPKDYSLQALAWPEHSTAKLAYPADIAALVSSIPTGMTTAAGLIFMIMFLGGMFGVLRASGAIDAGMERLVAVTGGNVYVLAPVLMIVL